MKTADKVYRHIILQGNEFHYGRKQTTLFLFEQRRWYCILIRTVWCLVNHISMNMMFLSSLSLKFTLIFRVHFKHRLESSILVIQPIISSKISFSFLSNYLKISINNIFSDNLNWENQRYWGISIVPGWMIVQVFFLACGREARSDDRLILNEIWEIFISAIIMKNAISNIAFYWLNNNIDKHFKWDRIVTRFSRTSGLMPDRGTMFLF